MGNRNFWLLIIGFNLMIYGMILTIYRVNKPIQRATTKTDTIFKQVILTDTVKIVVPVRREVPVRVEVYLPDTIRRQRLERDTIVSGLKYQDKRIEIQTISPLGSVEVKGYEVDFGPRIESVEVDNRGNLAVVVDEKEVLKQRRKSRWRKIGNYSLMVGSFVLGAILL